MTNKDEIVGALRDAMSETEKIVASISDAVWSKQVYESWTAKQLFCHIAADSSIAGVLITLAKMPAEARRGGPAIDENDWNARQVLNRQDKPIEELTGELRSNVQRDIQAIQSQPDELFSQHFRAPWGEEGRLSDVIMGTITDHFQMHLGDLRTGTA